MFSDDEKKFLIDNYPTMGRRYCADKLNKPYYTIANMAQKMNLKILPGVRSKIVSATRVRGPKIKSFDQYKVNPSLFIDNISKESAYILGLIWADGFVDDKRISEIRIKCLNDDILNVSKTFKKTGNWVIKYDISQPNRSKIGLIRTSNRPLAEFLIKNNYRPHNTKSADLILNTIPDNLKKYWFRGLIDGDGCWYVNQPKYVYNFTLCGCYEQDWTYFEQLLQFLNIKYTIYKRKKITESGSEHKGSVVRVRRKLDFIELGNYIYDGFLIDKIGFNRKYEKYILAK